MSVPATAGEVPGSPTVTGPSRLREGARRVECAVLLFAVGWAIFYVLQYLDIALRTVDFPYQLEWMEGGFAETVERLLAGGDIYPQPGLDYVGYIYPPLYFLVSAGFSLVMGTDLFALRLVSLLSTLGVGALLVAFLWRETRSLAWPAIGLGLFFATYELGGRWFHIARVDSLYLLLLMAALYALRFGTTRRSAVWAGVLMAAAFLTKQTAVIALLPAGLALLLTDRARALVAGAVGTAIVAVAVAVLVAATDGWFWYYLVEVPRQHTMLSERVTSFWDADLADLWLALGASVLALGVIVARDPRRGLFYTGVAAGLIVSAWLARIHDGGWFNVVIPAFLAVALILPMGLAALAERLGPPERARLGASPSVVAMALLVILQLAVLSYSTRAAVPPPDAQERGDRFLAFVASLPGDVLLPDWRFLPTWADKRSYGLGMAAQDVRRMKRPDDPGKVALEAELRQAFAEHRFSYVIVTDRHHPLLPLMLPHYEYLGSVDLLAPMVAGATVRPRVIYVPRDPQP